MHFMRTCISAVSPFLLLAWSGVYAQVSPEERALVQTYIEQEASPIAGSINEFATLAQPYAPLDFQIRQSNNEHASALRNYFFGVSSAVAGLSGSVAPQMANDFHCGDSCTASRIRSFVDQNQQVSSLVMRFVPLTSLNVIAQWGTSNNFRINDTFIQQNVITTYIPAGTIGIVPNSTGKRFSNVLEATGLTFEEAAVAKEIAIQLAFLHLAAIVRSPQGVRVIRTGNADNQCGLLFKRLSVKEPKQGDSFGEGLDVNGVTKLAPDIYCFETN